LQNGSLKAYLRRYKETSDLVKGTAGSSKGGFSSPAQALMPAFRNPGDGRWVCIALSPISWRRSVCRPLIAAVLQEQHRNRTQYRDSPIILTRGRLNRSLVTIDVARVLCGRGTVKPSDVGEPLIVRDQYTAQPQSSYPPTIRSRKGDATMKFMLTFNILPDKTSRNEAIARFMKTGGQHRRA
jgi:hypothetical protein